MTWKNEVDRLEREVADMKMARTQCADHYRQKFHGLRDKIDCLTEELVAANVIVAKLHTNADNDPIVPGDTHWIVTGSKPQRIVVESIGESPDSLTVGQPRVEGGDLWGQDPEDLFSSQASAAKWAAGAAGGET